MPVKYTTYKQVLDMVVEDARIRLSNDFLSFSELGNELDTIRDIMKKAEKELK